MKNIFLILFLLIQLSVQGQEWTRQLDGPNLSWASAFNGKDVQQTADSGYVMTGILSLATGAPRDYPSLVKVDKNGTTVWEKSYFSDNGDVAYFTSLSLVTMPNNNLLLAALMGNTIHLIQTNSTGDTIWTKEYASFCTGGPCITDHLKLRSTHDGNYMLMVGCHTVLGAPIDLYHTKLIKINPAGAILWEKSYQDVWAEDVQSIVEGGYVLAGHKNNQPMLFQVDMNGDSTWLHTYVGMPIASLHSVVQTADSGYVIATELSGFAGTMPMLSKVRPTGDSIVWSSYTIASSLGAFMGRARHVSYDPNGYYVVTGHVQKSHPILSVMIDIAFITKVDLLGNIVAEQAFETSTFNKGMVVRPTNDQGYIMVGDYDNTQGYLVKTDGALTVLSTVPLQKQDLAITVFPNPLKEQTTWLVEDAVYENLSIQIFDVMGRQVLYKETQQNNQLVLSRAHLETGIYGFQLVGDGQVLTTGKLVVE